MSALPAKKPSNLKSLVIIGGILVSVGLALLGYLMFYVSPDMATERVKLIANTEKGCIVETSDGFAVNIGPCDGKPGEFVVATYDTKVKERAALMNPTGR